jgi:hypothetical protein
MTDFSDEKSAVSNHLELALLPRVYCVCRLPADSALPEWATGDFLSVTRTPDELSILCDQSAVPAGIRAERDWRALRITGTLDFSLTGILASLAIPLAAAGISIFAVSTFDTDYVLVKADRIDEAIGALEAVGHRVER